MQYGIYECRTRGFSERKITPLVGDLVNFTITDEVVNGGRIEKLNKTEFLYTSPVANVIK